MRAQCLLPGSERESVAAAASAALAIQAQDVATGLLGVRARTTGLTAAKAARARGACRSWLMRNTLFLFAERDLAWMRPVLAERPLTPAIRRLGQVGLPPDEVDRLIGVLADRVAARPLPRDEARALLLAEVGDPGENSAHLLDLPRRGVAGRDRDPPAAGAEADLRPGPARRAARPRGGLGPSRPPLPQGPRPCDARRPRLLGQDPEGRGTGGLGARGAHHRGPHRTGPDDDAARPGRAAGRSTSRWSRCSAPGTTGFSRGPTVPSPSPQTRPTSGSSPGARAPSPTATPSGPGAWSAGGEASP